MSPPRLPERSIRANPVRPAPKRSDSRRFGEGPPDRSEEHTSELKSLMSISDAVYPRDPLVLTHSSPSLRSSDRNKIRDPALGHNQGIGAKALERRGVGKERAGAAPLRNEATGKILIRCRRLGFPSDPFAQIPCAPPRKGAIAVDSAKVRQMLVPGLLARGIEE